MTDVRILTEPLGGTPLSQLLQRGAAPRDWLAIAPVDADGWRQRARARAESRDWSASWDTLAPAFACGFVAVFVYGMAEPERGAWCACEWAKRGAIRNLDSRVLGSDEHPRRRS